MMSAVAFTPRCRLLFAAAVMVAAALAPVAGSASRVASTEHRPDLARAGPADDGRLWRPGCPVPLSGLRLISATHHGFDGHDHQGTLIVNRDAPLACSPCSVASMPRASRFAEWSPVDAYGGDDGRSIDADNTSAFNCRFVDGTTRRYSQHAYGRAIDVNPIENPSVDSAGTTDHRASRPYVRRTPFRPGMAAEGHALVAVPSMRSAGAGADAGRAGRTTSTSPPPGTDGERKRHVSRTELPGSRGGRPRYTAE